MSKAFSLKKLFVSLFKLTALVQIFFAFFWLFGHLFTYSQELLSDNYIEAAKTLKVDDYMGILYAFLVRIFGHGTFLYIVQAFSVFLAVFLFCKSIPLQKNMCVWASLYVLTCPFVLQCTCLVLPHAFVLSVVFLMLSAWRLWKLKSLFVLNLLLGFLNPDCTFLSLMALLPICILSLVKKKKHALFFLLSVLAAFIITYEVNNFISVPYLYGNAEKSISLLILQRISLGHLNEASETISTYYGSDFYADMLSADKVPENLFRVFACNFEKAFGGEAAESLYTYLSKLSLAKGPGYYGRDIIKDFLLYFFTPFSAIFVCLNDISGTLIFAPLYSFGSGMNQTFTKLYILIHTFMAAVFILLMLVHLIKKTWIKKKGLRYKGMIFYFWFLMAVNAAYGALVCLRGYDYRNALFILTAFIMIPILHFEGDED